MTSPRHLLSIALVAVACVATPALAQEAAAPDAAAPTSAPAKAQPVDFRKLKEALPATLAGLPKGEATGQRTKMGDVTLSQAEAPYGKDEGDAAKHGKITMLDYGSADFAKGIAIWLQTELDQESDKEYTKTADVQGRKAMITYNSEDKRGSLQTLAGNRVIVSLELNGVTDAEFKKAIDELPLKAVDKLVAEAK